MAEDRNTGSAAGLAEAAARIWDWQQARGWTTARMLREFPDLGSDKTYGSIRAGRTSDLDLDAWAARYMAVVALIDDSDAAEPEAFYEKLSGPIVVRRAMVSLFAAAGNARVLVLLGPSGIGKTKSLEYVAGRYGNRVAWVEAFDVWQDRPGALLGAVIRALGHEPPASAVLGMDKAVALLRESRRCTVVDEAHHLGPHCLNTIKALVNRTPGEFVLSAIPKLWKRMEGDSYEEARQVTTNRLAERVELELTEPDCARYFELALPGADKALALQAAKMAMQPAAETGNFAFLRDVCGEARRMTPDGGAPTAAILAEAITSVTKRRRGTQRNANGGRR